MRDDMMQQLPRGVSSIDICIYLYIYMCVRECVWREGVNKEMVVSRRGGAESELVLQWFKPNESSIQRECRYNER